MIRIGIAAIVLAMAVALPAAAHEGGLGNPTLLSGGTFSPFATCSVDPEPSDPQEPGLELEPVVAVSPQNPDHIAAAWIQSESLGLVAARSSDGGRSWQRSVVPGLTACSGGDDLHKVVFNPSLAFSSDGKTLYLAATASGGYFPNSAESFLTRVMVARWLSGGTEWEVTQVPGVEAGVDYPQIAASPSDSAHAMVVWSERTVAVDTTLAAVTTDGGETWSPPRAVRVSEPNRLGLNEIVATGGDDYALVTAEQSLTAYLGLTGLESRTLVHFSGDGGLTWNQAASCDGFGLTAVRSDSGVLVAVEDLAGSTVQLVDIPAGAIPEALSRECSNRQAGAPLVVTPGTRAVDLAADGAGNLAVASIIRPSRDGADPTELEIGVSHRHGAGAWQTARLQRGTRMPATAALHYAAPRLAGQRRGFAAVFALGEPQAADGLTDIGFQLVGMPPGG